MISPVKRVLAMRSFKTPKPRKMRAVAGAVRPAMRENATGFSSMVEQVLSGAPAAEVMNEWGMRYANQYVAKTAKVNAERHATMVKFHKSEAWRNPDPAAKQHHRVSAETATHHADHSTRVSKMHGGK